MGSEMCITQMTYICYMWQSLKQTIFNPYMYCSQVYARVCFEYRLEKSYTVKFAPSDYWRLISWCPRLICHLATMSAKNSTDFPTSNSDNPVWEWISYGNGNQDSVGDMGKLEGYIVRCQYLVQQLRIVCLYVHAGWINCILQWYWAKSTCWIYIYIYIYICVCVCVHL